MNPSFSFDAVLRAYLMLYWDVAHNIKLTSTDMLVRVPPPDKS